MKVVLVILISGYRYRQFRPVMMISEGEFYPPQGTGRSKEEVDAILSAAKLERKDLLPVSQEIAFSTKFSGTEYRLIELPKDVSERIKAGSRLVFRGGPNEPAVFCTDDATFEIKEAETSNSLLIFHDLAFPEQAEKTSRSSDSSASSKSPDSLSTILPVIPLSPAGDDKPMDVDDTDTVIQDEEVVVRTIEDIVHSYLELKKITPNLCRIRNALAMNPYKGPRDEDEEIDNNEFFTLEKLMEIIPASVGEIMGYLQRIRVIDFNGALRLIDDDYLFRAFSLISGLVDENSWKLDRIPKSVVITTLISLEPVFVLDKIFEWFFSRKSEENEDIYYMKEDEVCRFFGEVLLKTSGRFNLGEFLKVWQESVPEGLKTNLKQLEGVAVTNVQAIPAVIWHFPEFNLPDSATDRFAVLFEAKPKWTLDEISPFLRNLPSCQSIGILLTKFARVNTVNGVKYYSSKHSK